MAKDVAGIDPPALLYGVQTRLSLQHFGAPGRRICDIPALIRNYVLIKKAAAQANHTHRILDETTARAIVAACDEIAAGLHLEQFPTALVLGGGGTTTNMNVNEVVAARASQLASILIHPNDHVNASQSTNDTMPTAMALTIMELVRGPVAALRRLTDALLDKAATYDDTTYLGRTCLQDAVTLRAGQTLRAQAHAIARGTTELEHATGELSAVPLGATVLGTSIGAPPGFTDAAVATLGVLVNLDLTPTPDPFDALAHLDRYAAVADAASRVATTVAKIATDLRLRSSGPGGGFAEVTLPALQAGSSIMPAKINPVVPEYAMQLSYRIRGATHTVNYAVAAGELEVNVMEPIILDSLLTILDDLDHAAATMTTHCISQLEWNGPRRTENASHALDRWIERATKSGYETAVTERQNMPAQP